MEAEVTEVPSSEAAPPASSGGFDSYFKLSERGTNIGTEVRAGVTTFLVMAYIIFLNPLILSNMFPEGAERDAFIPAAAAATALLAGLLTIVMGLAANYPIALAAGLGINAIVAFTLVLGLGLSPAGAMGVIVLEGLIVLVLVHRRPAGGDHERGPARPEAGDRRRDRPLHPVHRLRGWRADRSRQPDRRVQLPGRDSRRGSSCSASR